jgi:hypothetical protein
VPLVEPATALMASPSLGFTGEILVESKQEQIQSGVLEHLVAHEAGTLPRSTVTPTADTNRSWALFPHGLLVFERTEPEASHLLVSRVDACTTPGCECRDIGLRAITVVADDSFDPALLSSDALLARFATEAMEARLDIDTGSVTPDDYDGRVPLSADWIQYLQSQVDGELLDVLHEKWLHTKGMKSAPKTDWESRPTGDLVGWYEAHPSDRPDVYLDDDGAFIAEDLFCVRPTCTCDEAVIAFTPAKIASAQDVGSIRLRISTLEVIERRIEANDAALLDRLWLAFSARHRRLTARLAERNKQMVELASDHLRRRAPARSAPRAGRNEPCPCGSGKKYKRCCG